MILNVAKDFSPYPAGRYLSDGPYSGEGFLQQRLIPALEEAQIVRVILDGTMGYGSSFLEEAFGGLVRLKRWSLKDLNARLKFVSNDEPSLIKEIEGYMKDAAR